MIISSEVKSLSNDNSFPKLMKSSETGKIVLFWAKEKGILLNVGRSKASRIGDVVSCFNMYNFTNFYGKIELNSNK